MKFFPFASLICLVMVTLFTVSNASPANAVVKRTGQYQSIVETFAKIAATIKGLDQSQTAAGQTGTPDFSLAAKGLAELAMEAESAEMQLRAIGTAKLDASSAASIGGSVTASSQYVKGITMMVQAGKQWFEKNHVTQTVVTILKTNIAQFRSLFHELNRHVDYATLQSYAPAEITFICSMVNAVVDLDPSAISSGAKAFCASQKTGYFDPNVFGGCTNAPKGYGSCGNSPTTFFQQAYTSGTMGSSSTSCTSGTQPPKSFSIPSNCLKTSH
ncbi:uncharacterized protein FA14DRAFT_158596 [Meira miltonrushii]|uniref:Secreted protein n=1 Tax=Meira miltonrushii TaxID=1280837 RepID=A0A316V2U3_9BASI|nr:uncharacterized protein FA14DRAFT_158596 [Meira miltonrushii]PWN31782.1 hypothetical protein FA14DRAFT_158596 [Meira miltonrushii]